jgi:hypothetical protein
MDTAHLVPNIFAMPSSGAPFPRAPFPRAPYCHGDGGHIAYRSGRAELVS